MVFPISNLSIVRIHAVLIFIVVVCAFNSVKAASNGNTDDNSGDFRGIPFPHTDIFLKEEVATVEFDGAPRSVYSFASDQITLRTVPIDGWNQMTDPSTKASMTLRNRYYPDSRIYIHVFKKSELPYDLSKEVVLGLFVGFRAQYAENQFQSRLIEDEVTMSSFLSYKFKHKTYFLDYQFEEKGVVQRVYTLFFESGEFLFVFSLQCPESLYEQSIGSMESYVRNLAIKDSR